MSPWVTLSSAPYQRGTRSGLQCSKVVRTRSFEVMGASMHGMSKFEGTFKVQGARLKVQGWEGGEPQTVKGVNREP